MNEKGRLATRTTLTVCGRCGGEDLGVRRSGSKVEEAWQKREAKRGFRETGFTQDSCFLMAMAMAEHDMWCMKCGAL
jgi:hypothetical protein